MLLLLTCFCSGSCPINSWLPHSVLTFICWIIHISLFSRDIPPALLVCYTCTYRQSATDCIKHGQTVGPQRGSGGRVQSAVIVKTMSKCVQFDNSICLWFWKWTGEIKLSRSLNFPKTWPLTFTFSSSYYDTGHNSTYNVQIHSIDASTKNLRQVSISLTLT